MSKSIQIRYNLNLEQTTKKLDSSDQNSLSEGDLDYVSNPVIEDNFNNRELVRKCILEIIQKGYPYRRQIINTNNVDISSALRKFLIALDAYLESSNPLQDPNDILIRIPEGYKEINQQKKIRMINFIKNRNLNLCEWDDDYINIPVYENLRDIGDIFNPSYWFPWKEPLEDYKFGLIPLKNFSKEQKKIFQEKLYALLPDDKIENIEYYNILYNLKGTVNLDEKFSKGKQWKIKGIKRNNFFSKKTLKGRRSQIFVNPNSQRDAVIYPVSTINSLSWIDKQLWEILDKFPESAMVKNNKRLLHKIDDLFLNNYFFLCRDIKKEGITKPRELIIWALETLSEKYPYLEAFKNQGIFEKFTLILESGEEVNLVRGHGLGFANALTTLIQIVLFHLIIDRVRDYGDHIFGDISCLAYNDDFVVGFKTQDDLESYYNKEKELLDEFQVIRAPTKSFWGSGSFVFLERYYPPFLNKKESYYRREVLNTLLCTNIVHAKSYISSINSFENNYIEDYLGEIIQTFGYEFFPDEVNVTFPFGGWRNFYYKNIDLNIKSHFDSDIYYRESSASYESCMAEIKLNHRRWNKKTYEPPILRDYPKLFDVSDEKIREFFKIGMTFGDLETSYQSLTYDNLINKYWKLLYNKRKRIYKESKFLYKDLLFNRVRETYKKEFLPPESFYDREIPFFYNRSLIEVPEEDPYRSKDPFMSLLNFSLGEKLNNIFPSEYEKYFPISEWVIKTSDCERFLTYQRLQETKWDFLDIEMVPTQIDIPDMKEEDFLLLSENYEHPLDLIEICQTFGGTKALFLEELNSEKKDRIKVKRSLYGRFLTLSELESISLNKINDPNTISYLLQEDFLKRDKFEELLEEHNRITYYERLQEKEKKRKKGKIISSNFFEYPNPWETDSFTADPYNNTSFNIKIKIENCISLINSDVHNRPTEESLKERRRISRIDMIICSYYKIPYERSSQGIFLTLPDRSENLSNLEEILEESGLGSLFDPG